MNDRLGGGSGSASRTRLYIQVAYQLFRETGQWPTVREVHRRLVRDHDLPLRQADVQEFFRLKSGAYEPGALARLSIADLRIEPAAGDDVSMFVRALGVAVEGYFSTDSPELTRAQVVKSLGIGDLEARRLFELLQSEPWLWLGSSVDEDYSDWRFLIGDDMHLLRGVDSPEAFMARKSEILGPTGVGAREIVELSPSSSTPATTREPCTVFMVRGRNQGAANALHDFLTALGIRVLSWSEAHSEATRRTGKASPYVLEIVRAGIDMVNAVVVLMTPDDEVRLLNEHAIDAYETESGGQARPNVVLELGMAIALYPQKTILVTMGRLRSISDISGVYETRMNNTIGRRQYLHDRLRDLGCDVNLQGRWAEAGDFDAVLTSLSAPAPVAGIDPDVAPEVSADAAGVQADEGETDGLGFMDLLAEGEDAFETITTVITEATQILDESGRLAEGATAQIKEADERTAGMRGRLAVVARYADALRPHADRFDELSQTYIAQWRAITPAIDYLVGQIESEEALRVQLAATTFASSLSQMVDSMVVGADKLSQFAEIAEDVGQGSNLIRSLHGKLARAARRWAEPVPIARTWKSRLASLGLIADGQ